MKPTALILRTAGTNCDLELARGFEMAGASAQAIHINELIENPAPLQSCDLIGIPGGFSYGDDIAAGKIFAHRLRYKLLEPLLGAVERGAAIIAPCNGFQVLVKLGLLPGNNDGHKQTASLAENSGGRFIDRWVKCEVPADTRCIWTKGLSEFDIPIAHGEGRFVACEKTINHLKENNQIALRYSGDNPNGSIDNIAGICDSSGLVFGLMPHPERNLHPANKPDWTSAKESDDNQTTGLQMFKNAVDYVKNR